MNRHQRRAAAKLALATTQIPSGFTESSAAERQAFASSSDADAHSDRGITLRAQGKIPEAIAAFRQAIQLEPDKAVFHLISALRFTNVAGSTKLLDPTAKPFVSSLTLPMLTPTSARRCATIGNRLKRRSQIAKPSNLIRNLPPPTSISARRSMTKASLMRRQLPIVEHSPSRPILSWRTATLDRC